MTIEKSEKSYGVAVALCGVFGILGIHHFYLGNFLHGIVDLGLTVAFFALLGTGNDGLALLVILVDLIHTIIVFYRLITEQQLDGRGRKVRIN